MMLYSLWHGVTIRVERSVIVPFKLSTEPVLNLFHHVKVSSRFRYLSLSNFFVFLLLFTLLLDILAEFTVRADPISILDECERDDG